MRFTGTSYVDLPRVNELSFAYSGIRLSDTGVVEFRMTDVNSNQFGVFFSGGYIVSNSKIISTYNTIDESYIEGYISGSGMNYKVNGVYDKITFPGNYVPVMRRFYMVANSSTVFADVSFMGKPIQYSLSFQPSYLFKGKLLGQFSSDTTFNTLAPDFVFFNSNKPLLDNPYPTGFVVTAGAGNAIAFNDVDDSYLEYSNNFAISVPTSFGDIGGEFTSERTGVSNSALLELADASDNNYYQQSLFDGYWSGKSFTYTDTVLTYNLNFNYSNKSFIGQDYPSTLSMAFQPLQPGNNSGYGSLYITGFNLINSGGYSVTPSFSGAQYYYITGIQNPFQSLLFSTGCGNIGVTYTGAAYSSGASGALILKSVKISGIYGAGVNTFKMISGYSGISNGSGYQSAPRFVLSTGGACYSLPDASGVELAQFKRASGYGAVYAQAAGLTGAVLMDGTGISGVQVTNIGFGYNSSLPPVIKFARNVGDIGTSGASGLFLYKTTGLYHFDQFWKASYNVGGGYGPISGYNGYYSGVINVTGAGNVQFQLTCSGLDNTSPVSGLLTVILSGNGFALTGQRIVSQSRTFDMSPNALSLPPYPSYPVVPLPDTSYSFDQDQFDYQYFSDAGSKVDSIINF